MSNDTLIGGQFMQSTLEAPGVVGTMNADNRKKYTAKNADAADYYKNQMASWISGGQKGPKPVAAVAWEVASVDGFKLEQWAQMGNPVCPEIVPPPLLPGGGGSGIIMTAPVVAPNDTDVRIAVMYQGLASMMDQLSQISDKLDKLLSKTV